MGNASSRSLENIFVESQNLKSQQYLLCDIVGNALFKMSLAISCLLSTNGLRHFDIVTYLPSWALSVFFNFFNNKKLFAFFIKLI